MMLNSRKIPACYIFGSLVFFFHCLAAGGENSEMAARVDAYAKRYAAGVLNNEPESIDPLVDEDLKKRLRESGMEPREYIEKYLSILKNEGSRILSIEVAAGNLKISKNGLVYLAPWTRRIETPIGVYSDSGNYLLTSYDNGETWGVVDNACFIPGMLTEKFPDLPELLQEIAR